MRCCRGAIAGNIDTATADPVIAIPPTSTVTDWSGGYVGLSYSSVDRTMEWNGQATVFEYIEDSAIGVFAGYNWQSSNLVYGVELNVTEDLVGVTDPGITNHPSEGLDTTIELRARAGYATGDALVYGFFGYGRSSYGSLGNNGEWAVSQRDVAGVTYGLGVDYMVTTSIFAGLEFSHRELVQASQTNSLDFITLRIGYNY